MLKKLLGPIILAANLSAPAEHYSSSPKDDLPCLAPDSYPQLDGPLNDQAKVLTDQEKLDLMNQIDQFEQRTDYKLALVTIRSLQGQTVENYTRCLEKSWGIDQEKNPEGIFFLIAITNQQAEIVVGKAAQKNLPEGEKQSIINKKVLPQLRHHHLSDGVRQGVQSIIAELEKKPPDSEDRMVLLVLSVLLGLGVSAAIINKILLYIRQNNPNLAYLKDLLAQMSIHLPPAEKEYDYLRKHHPKSIWGNFEEPLSKAHYLISHPPRHSFPLHKKFLAYKIDEARRILKNLQELEGFWEKISFWEESIKHTLFETAKIVEDSKQIPASHPDREEISRLLVAITKLFQEMIKEMFLPENQIDWKKLQDQAKVLSKLSKHLKILRDFEN